MNRLEIILTDEDLRAAVGKLPAPIALVTGLHYFENLKQKEIAQRLNLSIAMTRQHLGKGKYMIRKLSGCVEYIDAFKILYGDGSSQMCSVETPTTAGIITDKSVIA